LGALLFLDGFTMPLSSPNPRELTHTRKITCQGFQREDGLWDIEGSLIDTRTETMSTFGRGTIEPGEHLHEMWLRMTVDNDLNVMAIEAVTEHAPYPACPDFPNRFKKLVGEKIQPGWTAKVRLLLGGTHGCTHLVELLGPIATTAVQTVYAWKGEVDTSNINGTTPPREFINSCHSLTEGGEVARRLWSTD
jgi:hypothetical protein